MAALIITVLAFVQTASFSLVSRARNRDHYGYHAAAAFFSNGVWFLTFHELVKANADVALFLPYTIGTVLGSLAGSKVSSLIEKRIGASS